MWALVRHACLFLLKAGKRADDCTTMMDIQLRENCSATLIQCSDVIIFNPSGPLARPASRHSSWQLNERLKCRSGLLGSNRKSASYRAALIKVDFSVSRAPPPLLLLLLLQS